MLNTKSDYLKKEKIKKNDLKNKNIKLVENEKILEDKIKEMVEIIKQKDKENDEINLKLKNLEKINKSFVGINKKCNFKLN